MASRLWGAGRYGQRAVKIMREFRFKHARTPPAPAKVRAAFMSVSRPDHWQAVLEEFYRGR